MLRDLKRMNKHVLQPSRVTFSIVPLGLVKQVAVGEGGQFPREEGEKRREREKEMEMKD